MRNTRPECFKRAKNKGSQILRGKYNASQIKFKLSNYFKIFIFLEGTDPNIAKIVPISEIRKAHKTRTFE